VPNLALADQPVSQQLVGLWAAKRSFGLEVRGDLLIAQDGKTWTAEIAGHRATASLDGDKLTFALPEGKGSFRGRPLCLRRGTSG
jgi:hypothetical protein